MKKLCLIGLLFLAMGCTPSNPHQEETDGFWGTKAGPPSLTKGKVVSKKFIPAHKMKEDLCFTSEAYYVTIEGEDRWGFRTSQIEITWSTWASIWEGTMLDFNK